MITAVLMPTTSPREDTSGPPELPGLSAASVWITSSMSRPLLERNERPSADTTPVVTVEFEAERIADGDDQLAAFQTFGIAERRRRERHRLVDAQQREIGVGIVTHEPRPQVLSIGGGDIDPRRRTECAGDVAVGEDEAVRRQNDAGAGTAAVLAAILPVLAAAMHGETNHGRADPVDDVDHRTRVRIEQDLIVRGHRRNIGRRDALGAPERVV